MRTEVGYGARAVYGEKGGLEGAEEGGGGCLALHVSGVILRSGALSSKDTRHCGHTCGVQRRASVSEDGGVSGMEHDACRGSPPRPRGKVLNAISCLRSRAPRCLRRLDLARCCWKLFGKLAERRPRSSRARQARRRNLCTCGSTRQSSGSSFCFARTLG